MHMLNLNRPPDVHTGVGSSTAVRPIAAKRSIQSMLGQVKREQESRQLACASAAGAIAFNAA